MSDAPTAPAPVSILGRARFVIRFLAMLLWLIACVPLHYGAKLIIGRSFWPPRFLRGIARIIGARVRIEGRPLDENVFFVSNHLSWMDIPIIGGATRAAFIAKDTINGWPVIGWLARINNTVFVSNADRLGVADQIAQVRAALAEHQPILIFPEGTTSDGVTLRPFKPSLFAVLVDPSPGLCVQPLLIDYGEAVGDLAWVGTEPAPHNAYRMLARRGTFPVRLVFLDPIDAGEADGRKEISARAEAAIGAAHSRSAMPTTVGIH